MSELFQASQAVSVADPAPAQSPLFISSPDFRHPVVALAAALPGCFIYSAPTGLLQTHSGLKREEEGKGGKGEMLSGSFFSLGLGSAAGAVAAEAAAATAVLPGG